MNRHLWKWIIAVFAVFAAVVTVVELGSANSYKTNILSSRLEGYADIIARTDDYARSTSLLPHNIRVSVIDLDGKVIYDSAEPVAVMDNHLSRPEITASLKGEDGCSIRKSETAGIEYIYYARKYGDVIVRTALPFEITQKRFLHPDWILHRPSVPGRRTGHHPALASYRCRSGTDDGRETAITEKAHHGEPRP